MISAFVYIFDRVKNRTIKKTLISNLFTVMGWLDWPNGSFLVIYIKMLLSPRHSWKLSSLQSEKKKTLRIISSKFSWSVNVKFSASELITWSTPVSQYPWCVDDFRWISFESFQSRPNWTMLRSHSTAFSISLILCYLSNILVDNTWKCQLEFLKIIFVI